MNLVERSIAAVSPQWAAKRAYYRAVLGLSARSYDAAKQGRRTDGWITGGTGVNSEIDAALPYIRNRARDLVRNNPYAATAVRKLAAKTIGTGIVPRLKMDEVGDPRRKAARAIWDSFVENSDPEGRLDFNGQMNLLARTVFESGEALIRYLPRPASWRLPVPLQIEILEGDWIDSSRNLALPDGGAIIQGVQYDTNGRRAGYWLFDQHPGDTLVFTRGGLASKFVPADQIEHVFEPLRPHQARGVSMFTPVALKMKDVDDYDDAELMRNKVAACFAAFVTKPAGSAGSPLTKTTDMDSAGRRIERVGPGLIQYLEMGEDVEFGAPPAPSGYVDYMRSQLRAVAAGIGVTYEMMTGDLSQVNFSSLRGGMIDFWDLADQWQWLMFIPQACNPVWKRVGQVAAAKGLRNAADPWVAKWTTPARRFVNPKEDIDAARESVRSGFRPLFDVMAEQGEDGEETLNEMAETNKLLDKFGLILDSDPRKVGRPSASATPSLGGDIPKADQQK